MGVWKLVLVALVIGAALSACAADVDRPVDMSELPPASDAGLLLKAARKLLQAGAGGPSDSAFYGTATNSPTLPTQSPTAINSPSTNSTASSGDSGDSWAKSNLVWIVIVAVIVFILLHIPICGGVYIGVKWFLRKQKEMKATLEKAGGKSQKSTPASEVHRDLLPKNPQQESTIRYFSIAELEEATHDFSRDCLLGSGGSGEVFKGRLSDGTIVAIKRRIASREGVLPQFENEAQILSRLMHPNLVNLIGWCDEDDQQALVFPYLTNGSLQTQLEKDSGTLSWTTRLRIAVGAACGLEFLHSCNIIHRDVKSSNVLLDHEFTAKVSDCGISRDGPAVGNTHVSTGVKGTIGYLDPEYYLYHQLTERSDTYSFGVVLVEVITGKVPIDLRRAPEQHNLLVWAKPLLEKGEYEKLLDPKLAGKVDLDSLKQVAEIALQCLQDNSKKRPTMTDVKKQLEQTLALAEKTMKGAGGLAVDVTRHTDSDGNSMDSFADINLNYSIGSTFGALVTPKGSESEATTPRSKGTESTSNTNTATSASNTQSTL